MAKPSKLDRAIADATARWEEAKENERLAGAVLQALIDVREAGPVSDTPKVKRTRKKKGLPSEAAA